ncbi:hypothetical protein GGQ73_002535 [Rhizobium skierniewicense]|uniref:Uncharacterized protein n=1 Tax=Rhizobium skierniewicense TaxID=984260 RepID=A0A7W6G3J4_9HYPH|nr:hypothetical protein [Rhizobium skierniewicense]MBB3946581.1 hypothetical protein [Rhizobium skierniewicense]
MIDMSEPKGSMSVTADQLLSRTFTFRVAKNDTVISEDFVFHKNGFLIGYSHPNEMFWEMDGQCVNILDKDGGITCRLSLQPAKDGVIRLGGYFRDPASGYEQTSNFHILEENSSDSHTKIQSFDLFDTLVARRCHDPLEIFHIVERKAGVAGFADKRHRVEMSVFGHHPYGLDDIYTMMVADGFLTEKQANVLKWMELEEEWDHLFPIGDVVARVNADDIVISDMYLPFAFIERVLKEKCGLDNKLYLSNYGKHHKLIWPEILETYDLRSHFGDNIQADIISPSSFGIGVNFVTISKWDRTEEILHAIGLGPYAHAVRETRLHAFHPNIHIRHALNAQASVNIPLMILGTFWIRLLVEQQGADKILMAARDCNLWHEMVSSRHFAKAGIPHSEYVRISRSVCYIESAEYEAYFQGKLGRQNLLVDFVGTGRSLGTIVQRMGRGNAITPCVLMGEPKLANASEYRPETLVLKDFHEYRIFFEALNASLDGSAVLTVLDNHRLKVLQQDNEFSDLARMIISAMRETFGHVMAGLDRFDPPTTMPTLDNLKIAADAIAELIPAWGPKLAALQREQKNNLSLGNPLHAVKIA